MLHKHLHFGAFYVRQCVVFSFWIYKWSLFICRNFIYKSGSAHLPWTHSEPDLVPSEPPEGSQSISRGILETQRGSVYLHAAPLGFKTAFWKCEGFKSESFFVFCFFAIVGILSLGSMGKLSRYPLTMNSLVLCVYAVIEIYLFKNSNSITQDFI